MSSPSPQKRDKAAKSGHALPDGSFPIETVDDLKKAIKAVGRAKDPDRARRHVIKRARALGRTDLLPGAWNAGRKTEAAVDSGPKPPTRAEVLAGLRVKAARYNALTASAHRADLAPLLAVYRRGVGAWTPEKSRGMSAHEHGHARVNAYLCALRSDAPGEGRLDRDLLPRR